MATEEAVKEATARNGGVAPDPEIIEALEWLQVRQGGRFEDWGCGSALMSWAKPLVTRMQYIGIDKNPGPDVDIVMDLVHRVSDADSIFMHHVLATCGYWSMILDNALRSFRQRMVIVEGLFLTPAMIEPMIRAHARPFDRVELTHGRHVFKVERE